MTFADEIDSAAPEIAVLDQLNLGSGTTISFSVNPVEYDGDTYEPRLLQVGNINRKLSGIMGGLSVEEYEIVLANEDTQLSKQDIAKSLNRAYTRKLLANGQVHNFFSGLANMQYGEKTIIANIFEKWEKYFGESNRWYDALRISSQDWPGMPSSEVNKIAPVILGIHDSRGSGYSGMVGTIELTPTLFLVAGHACKSVGPVFVSGEEQLSGYSVHLEYSWTGGINSMATIIEFTTAPDSAPTCDVQGMTSDLTSSGELLENPIDQAEALREHVFGMPDSEVNSTDIAAARTFCANYLLRGARYINSETPGREIMSELLGSFFLFGGSDNDGKWTIKYLAYPFTDGGGTAISEQTDILPETFSVNAEPNQACNDLTVQYLQASGIYKGELNLTDSTSQTDLQNTYQLQMQLPWVIDPVSARTVAEWVLYHLKRGAASISWGEQLQHSDTLDLGGQVAVTHRAGPDDGGSGYSDQEFIITGMSFDLLSATLAIKAMDVRHWAAGTIGSHAELGDNSPMTVI